jgi:lipopolysaccharide export system protein LptC
MSFAHTETAAERTRIYRSLQRRNGLITVLRFLVPTAGAAVFVLILAQIVVANLGENFTIGRVSIESNKVVVETPAYSGIAADGSTYQVKAAQAEAALATPDAILLRDATLVINGPNGVQTTAEAPAASLQTTAQTVGVDAVTTISTSSGMGGTLTGMQLDLGKQVLTASGAIDFAFPGGEQIQASAMSYDGTKSEWRFSGVTVTFPELPRVAE